MDIEVKDLYKAYDNIKVFEGLNISFKEKKITCVMGPSGCGKTTLMRMLMNMESPDRGHIVNVPKNRAAVFQEDRLFENFSCISNVAAVLKGKVNKEDIVSHLIQVGLTKEDVSRPVCKLSGGMKRRVAIVRAIYSKPEVLFMDEPFKGLDESTKVIVMNYVKRNIKDITTILVTHDSTECTFLGGELIEMKGSVADGDKQEYDDIIRAGDNRALKSPV